MPSQGKILFNLFYPVKIKMVDLELHLDMMRTCSTQSALFRSWQRLMPLTNSTNEASVKLLLADVSLADQAFLLFNYSQSLQICKIQTQALSLEMDGVRRIQDFFSELS